MFSELDSLLSSVGRPDALKSDYIRAIDVDNCLGKRSGRTRVLTYRHLTDLYSLDPAVVLFRALVYFWRKDPAGRPLVFFLCANARDSVLRETTPFILQFSEGSIVSRGAVEAYIDANDPGRFSPATLKSTAQNINASCTQVGLLTGRASKIRTRAKPTAGSVSYALLLGYLMGIRGESLFRSDQIKLLDCSFEKALDLAEEASRKGWIVLKRVGDVIEVLFPSLLSVQDREIIREQS